MVKHTIISILLAISPTFAKEKTITTLRRQRLIKNRLNKQQQQQQDNTRKLEDFTFGPDESSTAYLLPEYGESSVIDDGEGEGEEITSRGYAWPPLDPAELAAIEEDENDGDTEYIVDKPSNPPTWLDDAFGADDFWDVGEDDDDEPTASPTWLDEEQHDDDFFWE